MPLPLPPPLPPPPPATTRSGFCSACGFLAPVLASSADCIVQALKWGTRAYSVQFHLEVEHNTVENWAKISAYSEALEAVMGKGGVEDLASNCKEQISDFNNNAERVYLNWMQTSAQT